VGDTRVQVCGRLAVTWDGDRIEDRLPARQGRLTFAFLVVHRGRPVSRDEMRDALGTGDATLRSLLSRLRRVLGADAITAGEDPRLVLPEGAFVDLEAAREGLHRAESAIASRDFARAWAPARVALHTAQRGFAPGMDAPWVEALRRELGEMRLRALECVGEAGLGMGGGEADAAERSGRRLVELAPYRESGHRLLMDALAARGNVAEALLVYEALRERLRDDLGVVPGPETRAAYERLVRSPA
jgi:SARP family transcriptional regulator, regulator of embCAB operon